MPKKKKKEKWLTPASVAVSIPQRIAEKDEKILYGVQFEVDNKTAELFEENGKEGFAFLLKIIIHQAANELHRDLQNKAKKS